MMFLYFGVICMIFVDLLMEYCKWKAVLTCAVVAAARWATATKKSALDHRRVRFGGYCERARGT